LNVARVAVVALATPLAVCLSAPARSTAAPGTGPRPVTAVRTASAKDRRVEDYPRLANLYAYSDSEQAEAFSRYGLVILGLPA
jgi:hypothetical protein